MRAVRSQTCPNHSARTSASRAPCPADSNSGKSLSIVNVTAMEGKFDYANKQATHPHTNMAKASLNMLTRTVPLSLAVTVRHYRAR